MAKTNVAVAAPQGDRSRVAGLLGLVIVLAAGLMLSACNTTAGAGQDLSNAGKDVTKAAVDTKNKL